MARPPMSIATLAEPFSVALHAVTRAGSLCWASACWCSGCGPIGAMVPVAAARVHGAAEIVAADIVDEPLADP